MSKPEFTLRTGIYTAIEPDLFKGSLNGKVALVTGSGRGIGREIALALAKSGAAVAVTGRTKEQVDETTRDVLALGGKAIGVVADICAKADLERLVREVRKSFRLFQILVDSKTGHGSSRAHRHSDLQRRYKHILAVPYDGPHRMVAPNGNHGEVTYRINTNDPSFVSKT